MNKLDCECPESKDDMYHCKKCDSCCFGWGLFKEKNETYEDRGLCGQCILDSGMTLEEMVTLLQ